MSPIKLKLFILGLLRPFPQTREKLLAFYRWHHGRVSRWLQTATPLIAGLWVVYWMIMVPAKYWHSRRLDRSFGPTRKAGWSECAITTASLAAYADPYYASTKDVLCLHVRLLRKLLRGLRRIAPSQAAGTAKPPSDIYALF